MPRTSIIGVIDYSAGNLTSIFNALDVCNLKWKKISSLDQFEEFSHLILPGVGAFKHGMNNLIEKGFVEKKKYRKELLFLGYV